MSILIRGMEMPNRCFECIFLTTVPNFFCLAGKRDLCAEHGINISRPDWCPLVEIPTPHGRLGDLDALVKDLAVYRGGHNEGYGFDGGMYEAYNNSIELVEDAPTVIEAEGET